MPVDEQSGCFPRSENTEIGKYRFFTVEGRDAAGAAELLSVILRSEESGVIGQKVLLFQSQRLVNRRS